MKRTPATKSGKKTEAKNLVKKTIEPQWKIEEDEIPIEQQRAVPKQYPEIFKALSDLPINKCITFKSEIEKDFQSVKQYLHTNTNQRYIVRTLDTYNKRIWRIQDGAQLRTPQKRRSKNVISMDNPQPLLQATN